MNPSKPRAGTKLMTVKAVTEEMGGTRNYWYYAAAEGLIPTVQLPESKRILFRRSDVEAFIERHVVRG
jgi:Helix-turn-helix domain